MKAFERGCSRGAATMAVKRALVNQRRAFATARRPLDRLSEQQLS